MCSIENLFMDTRPREGVIIEYPLNGQFHDARDVILTSRKDVRGFAGDDDEPMLGTLKNRYKSLKWRLLMFYSHIIVIKR